VCTNKERQQIKVGKSDKPKGVGDGKSVARSMGQHNTLSISLSHTQNIRNQVCPKFVITYSSEKASVFAVRVLVSATLEWKTLHSKHAHTHVRDHIRQSKLAFYPLPEQHADGMKFRIFCVHRACVCVCV